MRLSRFTRILCYGIVVVQVLVSVGLLSATVSAKPVSSPGFQHLPTRPPASRPTSQPSAPAPPPAEPKATLPPPTPTPTPTAGLLPTTEVTAIQGPSTDVPLAPYVDLTFEELGYNTFQLSHATSRGVYLYLPRNLVPNSERSYLDLNISHEPAEPDKLSVLPVTFNDVPLAVITLSQENTEPTTYRFYLGNAPLTPGRNRLRISLDIGAGCGIRGARVAVAVHGSSSFHLEYSLEQPTPDLALYPIPFFERSFRYEPIYVVLPGNPSATDLSAAATIAAGLGKFSGGETYLVPALDTQISDEIRNNHHLIVVGKKGTNRLLDQLDLSLRLDDPVLLDEQGVIQELVSPWNPVRMILVVSSGSDAGLLKASQALNRDVRLVGMRGPVAIVQTALPPEMVESGQRDADFTLADLGYEEETVYGTTPQSLDYNFYMPLGWTTTEEPRFILYFGHAKAAIPATSSMDIYFNGVPIESVLLDESNASRATLEVPLPSWLIISGRNTVRIIVEMSLSDGDKCLFLDSGHLWTAVYSDSYLHLPYVAQDVESSLDLFPYPFTRTPNLDDTLLVLPDRPRQTDYELMLKVAVGLGAAGQGDFLELSAITADLFTQEGCQDKDLFLIGRPSLHSLIAELNDSLPQPFEPGSDLLSPKLASVIFVQDLSRDIGLIEELKAPWDPERIILVLTGTTDEGVALAGTTLLSQARELAGDVTVVEESVGIQTFDTRPLLSTPRSEVKAPDVDRTLLIQLGERWW